MNIVWLFFLIQHCNVKDYTTETSDTVASTTEPACLKHFVDIMTYEMKWSGGILTWLPEHPGDSYKKQQENAQSDHVFNYFSHLHLFLSWKMSNLC